MNSLDFSGPTLVSQHSLFPTVDRRRGPGRMIGAPASSLTRLSGCSPSFRDEWCRFWMVAEDSQEWAFGKRVPSTASHVQMRLLFNNYFFVWGSPFWQGLADWPLGGPKRSENRQGSESLSKADPSCFPHKEVLHSGTGFVGRDMNAELFLFPLQAGSLKRGDGFFLRPRPKKSLKARKPPELSMVQGSEGVDFSPRSFS